MTNYEVETQSGTIFNFTSEEDGKVTFTMAGRTLVCGLVEHFIQPVQVGYPVEMDFYKERSMTCPHGLSRYQNDVSYVRSDNVKRITPVPSPASAAHN